MLTVTVGEATPSSSPMNEDIAPILDSQKRTPNLWVFDLNGKGRQLTTFIGGSVRCPTVAGKSGDIAFEYGPDLWFLKGGKGEPEKIELFVAADDKQTTRRREKLSSGVSELAGLKSQTFASWVQQRRRQRKAAAKSQVTKSSAFTVRWLEAVVARTTNPIDGGDATLPVHLPGGCNDSPPQCSLSFGDIAHRLEMLRECRNSNGDWNGVQPSDL